MGSIDVLRGFSMFWLIGGGIVFRSLDQIFNHPATAFIGKQLKHVKWDEGFHFQDLIMPLFIFIMGSAVPFSISKRLERGQSRGKIHLHIIKRTAVLYLLGVLSGHWLRSNRPGNHKAAGLALAGLISLFVGYAWGQVFPIIRLLWTGSMALFAAGLSLLLLALFYWLIDIRGYKKWAFFFIVIGANPITTYVLQSVVDFNAIARLFVIGIIQYVEPLKPLILPLAALAFKWLLLWFLYRHKIFLRV